MLPPRLAAWPRKYLYQAPRGWVLKLTSRSNARMRAELAGQSVAVVGNAKSLLAADLGPQIDAHDVIIRLNKGFVQVPAAQGQRTDMVGLTPNYPRPTSPHFSPRAIC